MSGRRARREAHTYEDYVVASRHKLRRLRAPKVDGVTGEGADSPYLKTGLLEKNDT